MCAVWKNRLHLKKQKGIYVAHIHYVHLRERLCLGKPAEITFLLANTWSCSFKDRSAAVCLRSFSAKKLESFCLWMSIQMTMSICPFIIQTAGLYMGILWRYTICSFHETPTYCSWKLWKVFFFCPLCFFSATKLLHKVCLKTNTEYEERNTVIIQSIVLVFGAPRVCSWGTQMRDSIISMTN